MAIFARTFRTGLVLGTLAAAVVTTGAFAETDRSDGQTLKDTLKRGAVNCGVNVGLPGFSKKDDKGNWSGFDVDICRAVAAAIFNDPTKVNFTPLDNNQRLKALQDRTVDILSRNTTWSMSREVDYGLTFAAVSYYDGAGFMLRRSRNVDSALELAGTRICVQSDTTTQLNVADYFRVNNMTYDEMKFGNVADLLKAYEAGQCDVLTTDTSQLYAYRQAFAKPEEHVILADIISKEPLAPVVRQRDDQWALIVKWTVYAMLNAEELGVSSQNVDEALKSKKPDVMRLVGTEGNFGEKLGLTNDWAARVIRHVGNYGEVFERNVGLGSNLAIPRGLNQLWNAGGIQYAPPIR
ncbi:PEB1 OS=Afipia felis OX=1035 GN=peb1A PE=3 SV=1 [Afipia felis]